MKQFNTVQYNATDHVATVALNRPSSLNAFDKTLRFELVEALQQAANDTAIRIVLLTGIGRAFSSGADLKAGMPTDGQTVESILQDEYRPSLDLIAKMDKPVMAVINGPVAGIALGYMLQCDLAIMADSAYLLSPFTTISLVGDGGINWQLSRRLGYKRAYQLSVEGEKINAATALQYGLVNKVVPHEVLMAQAIKWSLKLVKRAPLSLAATKRVMRFAMQNTWESAFDLEAKTQLELIGGEDNVEGVTAFLEKREPDFKGKN